MPGQGSASASLFALRSQAQSNYMKCKASLESLKAASFRLRHRKLENALFCLSEKYVECRRARNITLEAEDEDRALLSARRTKLLADEASSLTLEKMANFSLGKNSLLRFALNSSFNVGQIKAIENFFADFMPEGEGIMVLPSQTPGGCPLFGAGSAGLGQGQNARKKSTGGTTTVYKDFVPWLGKYDVGDIWLRDMWVSLGKQLNSIAVQNTSFLPLTPRGRARQGSLSCLPVSGVRLKGGALVDNFGLDANALGLDGGQVLKAQYQEGNRTYCFNLLDMFAIDIPGSMARKPEGGAAAHFARMAGQCGYDFGRLASMLSEGELVLKFPEGDPREPTSVFANLSECKADSAVFSLFGNMHEGRPVISTEVQLTVLIDGESIWTAGFSFPKKQFFVREFGAHANPNQCLYWAISKEMVERSTG